jgi:hypothetical protein
MQHKKVIVDSYSVASGGIVDVRGRYNHVSSTEVDVERKIEITFQRDAPEEEKYADGFELASESNYARFSTQRVHIPPGNTESLNVKTKKSALNRSTQRVHIPPGSTEPIDSKSRISTQRV